MRAESDGLTIPMVVSTTTATATNTAPIVNPIHQSSAANARGSSRRVARRHQRLCGAARGASGISSQVDGVTSATRSRQKRV